MNTTVVAVQIPIGNRHPVLNSAQNASMSRTSGSHKLNIAQRNTTLEVDMACKVAETTYTAVQRITTAVPIPRAFSLSASLTLSRQYRLWETRRLVQRQYPIPLHSRKSPRLQP